MVIGRIMMDELGFLVPASVSKKKFDNSKGHLKMQDRIRLIQAIWYIFKVDHCIFPNYMLPN